jgi:hypothetical protein
VRPELAAAGLETHSATLDQIGYGRDGLAVVPAIGAHSQDQIPEAVIITVGFCSVLFHKLWLRLVDFPFLRSNLGANPPTYTIATGIDATTPEKVHRFFVNILIQVY